MKAEERWRGCRVVIDTNVWISAALSPNGSPAKITSVILAVAIPVLSLATFHELEERLWRPKFDRYMSPERRKSILHDLNAGAFWVEPSDEVILNHYCRDPDDDKFIWAALAAQAAAIFTGDNDLLVVPLLPGLKILSPAAALA